MAAFNLGLQLYTVRDLCAQDFLGTLNEVARIGYEGVEWAGMNGLTPEKVKAHADKLGLKSFGTHVSIEQWEQDYSAALAEVRTLGCTLVTIPWLDKARRSTGEGWKEAGRVFSEMGRRLAGDGITLTYHNHSFEFEKFDGEYGLDILYKNSDPVALQAEVDTYWAKHGGVDPAGLIRSLSGRCPIVHLKDMEPGPGQAFAEVGQGILDWPGILAACKDAGVKTAIVEQDETKGPALESVRISLENARKFGF
jgi:sugar phosphate isomerase/epimerase